MATISRTKRPVPYEIALVTYVDILGFRQLVETKSPGDISRIIRVVKEVVGPYGIKFKAKRPKIPTIPDEEFASFSDLSITSIPLRRRGTLPMGTLFTQLLHLVRAQSILIYDEGIVIRGGVTVGEITKGHGEFFGPAVIRAYDLESKVAQFPRIVVGQELLTELHGNPGLWMHGDEKAEAEAVRGLLREGDDGQLYVDYLRVIYGELEDPDDYLDRHRSFITERLQQHAGDAGIRAKYEWLDYYHRSTEAELKRAARRYARRARKS